MGRGDTDALIRRLACETTRDNQRILPIQSMLPLASLGSLALAVALAFVLFGAGDDLGRTLASGWFHQKLVCMAAVAGGAWLTLRDLTWPGRKRTWVHVAAILPAIALIGLGALLDSSELGLGGRLARSVPNCVGAIVLLALPGLILTLLTLRACAATTQPALAGAAAGLLTGALGGAAYALVCRNDGGVFVAVWYGLAVTVVASLGGIVGRRCLAW